MTVPVDSAPEQILKREDRKGKQMTQMGIFLSTGMSRVRKTGQPVAIISFNKRYTGQKIPICDDNLVTVQLKISSKQEFRPIAYLKKKDT